MFYNDQLWPQTWDWKHISSRIKPSANLIFLHNAYPLFAQCKCLWPASAWNCYQIFIPPVAFSANLLLVFICTLSLRHCFSHVTLCIPCLQRIDRDWCVKNCWKHTNTDLQPMQERAKFSCIDFRVLGLFWVPFYLQSSQAIFSWVPSLWAQQAYYYYLYK